MFNNGKSIRDSGLAQSVGEMLCIFSTAKGVYRKDRLDRELRCQVQRRRGMIACLIHLVQMSMARRQIGFHPVWLYRRASEAFDRFLILLGDEMNYCAVAPIPCGIEMRGYSQRLSEVV